MGKTTRGIAGRGVVHRVVCGGQATRRGSTVLFKQSSDTRCVTRDVADAGHNGPFTARSFGSSETSQNVAPPSFSKNHRRFRPDSTSPAPRRVPITASRCLHSNAHTLRLPPAKPPARSRLAARQRAAPISSRFRCYRRRFFWADRKTSKKARSTRSFHRTPINTSAFDQPNLSTALDLLSRFRVCPGFVFSRVAVFFAGRGFWRVPQSPAFLTTPHSFATFRR